MKESKSEMDEFVGKILDGGELSVPEVIHLWKGYHFSIDVLEQAFGDRLLKNIAVCKNGRKRFGYDRDGSNRLKDSLTFKEFSQRSNESLYIYGESLPIAIRQSIEILNSSIFQIPNLTSELIWVALDGNCSPLHYDLCNGLLLQLEGEKNIFMFPPDCYDSLYPFQVTHSSDRQSQIDDIHNPNKEQFPLYSKLLHTRPPLKFTVCTGDALFIPCGWWHQVESIGLSVSATLRWDDCEHVMRSLICKKKVLESLPLPIRNSLLDESVETLSLSDELKTIIKKRINSL